MKSCLVRTLILSLNQETKAQSLLENIPLNVIIHRVLNVYTVQ